MKNMIFTVSSLEKIFPEKTPKLKQKSFSVFQNEKFNFQIAVFPEKELCGVAIRAESSLGLRDSNSCGRNDAVRSCNEKRRGR